MVGVSEGQVQQLQLIVLAQCQPFRVPITATATTTTTTSSTDDRVVVVEGGLVVKVLVVVGHRLIQGPVQVKEGKHH